MMHFTTSSDLIIKTAIKIGTCSTWDAKNASGTATSHTQLHSAIIAKRVSPPPRKVPVMLMPLYKFRPMHRP